jgi:hypothetical protein
MDMPPIGAVLVDGGAEKVIPPRLPIEDPPPARANATPGAKARAIARPAARTMRGRLIGVLHITPPI